MTEFLVENNLKTELDVRSINNCSRGVVPRQQCQIKIEREDLSWKFSIFRGLLQGCILKDTRSGCKLTKKVSKIKKMRHCSSVPYC